MFMYLYTFRKFFYFDIYCLDGKKHEEKEFS